MKICLFYHSVISDWNHGNAHFLRGIISRLLEQGHQVKVFEPADGWSLRNLVEQEGTTVIDSFRDYFPDHMPELYQIDHFDPEAVLNDAELVLVHEWNDPKLVKIIGDYRAGNDHFTLLFHDTHHRAISSPEEMKKYDLSHYDGVLAFGEVLSRIYRERGWSRKVWTWHEAADTRIFHPVEEKQEKEGDLVWIGNWGDEERTAELKEFIIKPVRELGLKAAFYGVRYSRHALRVLRRSGIEYKGWVPNYLVPEVFSKYKVTVHVPRRPYVKKLPGIPTIRPFEAMASGIPLICSPWNDAEKLFSENQDYLLARDGGEMKERLMQVLTDRQLADSLKDHALRTILSRHTCLHRTAELLAIVSGIKTGTNQSRQETDAIGKTGRQEDRKTGRQEDRKTGRWKDRKILE